MKTRNKLKLLACITTFLLATPNLASAQAMQGEVVFTLDAGFSVTGGLIKAVFNDSYYLDSAGNQVNFGSSVKGGPALVLGCDIGLSERWSIGAIVTTQGWNGTAENTFDDENGNTIDEEVSFKLRRNNISICPKVHYGNGDNIDLYSGLRIGYIFWNSSIESKDPTYNTLSDYASGVSRINAGLTLFGSRFYVNDAFAVNMELNLGAPYMFGAGLNYRIL